MRSDDFYESQGKGKIHACRWSPEGTPRAVVQIVHGIAEHIARYEEVAAYLNQKGILVVGEDHMGHGQSINGGGIQGYFHGGWFTAVADSYKLLEDTRKEFPDTSYILLGHSMGSFMARTILCKYPDSGISGAIICGTGWQPTAALPALVKVIELLCKKEGETAPNATVDKLAFGSYNSRVEHPRTKFDWLTRENDRVDAYIADPLCGFTASGGLMRDMMQGIHYIQKHENLLKMRQDLPVFFIAGGDDPVGSYGKGVEKAADAFRKAGMKNVSLRLYPLCRHEIHNEINRAEVLEDMAEWIEKLL